MQLKELLDVVHLQELTVHATLTPTDQGPSLDLAPLEEVDQDPTLRAQDLRPEDEVVDAIALDAMVREGGAQVTAATAVAAEAEVVNVETEDGDNGKWF